MRQLFTHCTIVTVDEEFTLLSDAYLAMDGDTISYIGTERPHGELSLIHISFGQH